MSIVAISVDVPSDTLPWAQKKGLTMPLASDPQQEIILRFGISNPDAPELALHAVYIVDEDGKVFYRKVARRRPYSQEFLDAIDYRYGRWPREPHPGDKRKG